MQRVAFYGGFVLGVYLIAALVVASWYAPRCSHLLGIAPGAAVFLDECQGWVYYQTLPPLPTPQGQATPL